MKFIQIQTFSAFGHTVGATESYRHPIRAFVTTFSEIRRTIFTLGTTEPNSLSLSEVFGVSPAVFEDRRNARN